MKNHWIYFLADGASYRWCRMMSERKIRLEQEREALMMQLNMLNAQIDLEEDAITREVLKEWNQKEIQQAKNQHIQDVADLATQSTTEI